ncbi:Peroxisomal adenine nucleotide transporter 1 [Termitomyces sp. T112]|nr:Peroxisomal adenine nucleotide transporter 1 [Termitomyces sp. T112]
MTSSLPPLVQAFSGAIGSASANILTYPLDLVTTRVQLDPPDKSRTWRKEIHRASYLLRNITQRDGFSALYGGILTDTGAMVLSSFLYFYVYSFLRSLATKRLVPFRSSSRAGISPIHKPSMAEELVLGFIAGVLSRAVSTPLSMISLRLRAEETADKDSYEENEARPPRNSVVGAARSIYKEHGLIGFWRGFQTTVTLSLNPSITLAFFQLFRRLLALFERRSRFATKSNPFGQANPTPLQAFFGAAISNSITVCVLYPLILAKTRLQASSATSLQEVINDAYNGLDTYSHKHQEMRTSDAIVGISGLYRGLWVQLLKGILNQGVTFTVKGRIEEMIVNAYLYRRRCT